MGYKSSKKYPGVQSYKKKNGDVSYYIRYKDINGKTCRQKIGDKSKGVTEIYANNKRNEVINKLINGDDPLLCNKKKSKIVLNEMFEYYVENKDMKQTTKKDMTGRWNKHVQGTLGKKDASKITIDDLRKLRNSIGLSIRSKEIIIGYIYSTYKFCSIYNKNKFGKLINPMIEYREIEGINESKSTKKAKKRKRNRYLTLEDIKLLKDKVKDDFILKLGVEILLSTGVRGNALLQIRKRDIILENNTIILIDEKNGDELYDGYFSASLKKILIKYLKSLKSNEFLFKENGKQLTYSIFSKRLRKIINTIFNNDTEKNDVNNRVVIHTLRHTFASQLAINGTPIYTIKKLMNHKDIESTMRYAKLAPDSGKDNVEDLYKEA